MDKFLRNNPLTKRIPFLALPFMFITRTALEELGKQKQSGGTDSKDLMSQVYRAHMAQPDNFTEGDVFAIAHGAM